MQRQIISAKILFDWTRSIDNRELEKTQCLWSVKRWGDSFQKQKRAQHSKHLRRQPGEHIFMSVIIWNRFSAILNNRLCASSRNGSRHKASATHNRFSPDPDPNLIFSIRFTKPLYWWEKGGRDCGRPRRFGDSDTKYQLRINNRSCVAEASETKVKDNIY